MNANDVSNGKEPHSLIEASSQLVIKICCQNNEGSLWGDAKKTEAGLETYQEEPTLSKAMEDNIYS